MCNVTISSPLTMSHKFRLISYFKVGTLMVASLQATACVRTAAGYDIFQNQHRQLGGNLQFARLNVLIARRLTESVFKWNTSVYQNEASRLQTLLWRREV